MTFTIQSNSPTPLRFSGGGLGYGLDSPGGVRGIRDSIALKFDVYDNTDEIDNVLVKIDKAVLDLESQHVFQVDLTYDGTD